MNKYRLKQSPKTRLLNFVRRIFTTLLFEKTLVRLALNNSSWFIKKLIPPDYLYKKGSYRSASRNGINYHLDISTVIDHGLYFGYKEPDHALINEALKNAEVILDIGANVGSTALHYASINASAKIYAFEPHPDNFQKAKNNIDLNKFSNIQLINLGLGTKKETLKLYEVNENNPGMNRIISGEQKLPYKNISVDLLDHICEDLKITKADFIKIDVEGFEYAVLEGGRDLVKRNRPMLFIELDDNNLKANSKSAKELIELLYSFGYKKILRADNLRPLSIDTDFTNCHYDIVAK